MFMWSAAAGPLEEPMRRKRAEVLLTLWQGDAAEVLLLRRGVALRLQLPTVCWIEATWQAPSR